MYSAYKLNKQGDNIQPWRTPFFINTWIDQEIIGQVLEHKVPAQLPCEGGIKDNWLHEPLWAQVHQMKAGGLYLSHKVVKKSRDFRDMGVKSAVQICCYYAQE